MLTINNTIDGAIQDIEIKGNTVQDPDNLSDIKSVGELQEDGTYKMSILSCGKNLFNGEFKDFTVPGIPSFGDTNISKELGKVTFNATAGSFSFKCYLKQGAEYLLSFDVSNKTPNYMISINSSRVDYTTSQTKERITRRFISQGEDVIIVGVYGTMDKPSTLSNFQLEEGTVATSYEPYQENKCDILLPVQLEKVGDVADRIICKDGVWGVEKNVGKLPLTSNLGWYSYNSATQSFKIPFTEHQSSYSDSSKLMCNALVSCMGAWEITTEYVSSDSQGILVKLGSDKNPTQDLTGLKLYLDTNNVFVLYQRITPQFIPLPRDTQIQLNSFFGTTHVYMESGEVEGTIKCKIPKSLGATVQSLNNKTDILSDRIEAIEGLKDSQNMKYETDKGYLVCKETKNGVIDDLKIEGKTLVNKSKVKTKHLVSSGSRICEVYAGEPISQFTLVVDVSNLTGTLKSYGFYADNSQEVYSAGVSSNGKWIEYFNFDRPLKSFSLYVDSEEGYEATIDNVIILEGDHTQNPPSYFEGLMSVGQDVDKIEVLSRKEDGNLFDANNYISNTLISIINNGNSLTIKGYGGIYFPFFVRKGVSYKFTGVGDINITNVRLYKSTTGKGEDILARLGIEELNNTYVAGFTGIIYLRYWVDNKTGTVSNVQIKEGEVATSYEPYKGDKKQILFYNENGELEPIQELHEWDSIEKHSDNKWYYHKRSGKVVLNGSENWSVHSSTYDNCIQFTLPNSFVAHNVQPICSHFKSAKNYNTSIDDEQILIGGSNNIHIRILKSKLPTQDVQGFKQWLQANNVTVVYQLAQEEVYELAPLHLDSYANETLILCNSGAISPKMEFSITSHINELVKAYGERINLLEEKVYQYMVTQNRMQLASTYSADSVTFKVDYFSLCGDEENYDEDLYNLILNNILVGKDNYNYDKMFTIILDYASWNQISWEQFDILVGLMDMQHNPPVEEEITEDESIEETPVE